jgi:hypothetical protein
MQIADITLNDGSAVAQTFKPTQKNNLLVEYKDFTGSYSGMYTSLSCAMRPAKGDVARKVTIKVVLPYEYNDSDGNTKSNNITCFTDIVVPSTASASEIDDLIAFASGAIEEAQFTDAIKNGAFPY